MTRDLLLDIHEAQDRQEWDLVEHLKDALQRRPGWPKGWSPGTHLDIRVRPRTIVPIYRT